MKDPIKLLTATSQFYSANPSLEDGRLKAHRVEFEVTLRAILQYLPESPAKILDVGGGTGGVPSEVSNSPYSFALAQRGHDVTLVDLSQGLLDTASERITLSPNAPHPNRILQGNALDLLTILPEFEQRSFDIVLLLGPLYHIMSSEGREDAIRQAWTMVKPSGSLFCAWVSRWAHYRDVAMRDPGRLSAKKESYAKHAIGGDYVRLDEFGVAVHAMNHEHPAKMPVVLKKVTGLAEVKMIGTEGVLAGGLDKLVNSLEGDAFEAWVEKCVETGQDEYGWMMSDHIVGVARKV
ncbi:S-adenosyl-L-methionine-dependent methyltransferase [Cristinia sonorae]|uniref:S-adenosyl-L-methionine-dependent methyltransferase n=1 Tax=Cristinia sonorae TaxID=1940300 RepID=A0A8K0UE67_9AGAR|nr:S-adenosyl-L-methionine-dependent methyltransferase [Cristinia sonorae]